MFSTSTKTKKGGFNLSPVEAPEAQTEEVKRLQQLEQEIAAIEDLQYRLKELKSHKFLFETAS